MLLVDRSGRIVHANPPACRLLGRPQEILIGKRARDIGRRKRGGRRGATRRERPAGATPAETILVIDQSKGSSIEVSVRKMPAAAPRTGVWILRPLTPDRPKTAALEREISLLMEAERVGGVGGWDMNLETGIVSWTPEMRRIMGMPADTERVTLEHSYSFYTDASRSIVREAFSATLARGIPYDLVFEVVTATGSRIWVREVCRATMRNGRVVSVIGFTQDITEQRRLAALLNDIGNQERARIGADLHDGLGQELTGLVLLLRGIATRAANEGSALAGELVNLSELAGKSIETVREIAHGLLPIKLSHVGFRQYLQRLARSARATFGVRVRIHFHGLNAHMPVGEVAENLYRIAQESIANAVKHGHAKRVSLRVRASETKIIFTASDDGSGIELAGSSEGMGLRIMRYRTRMLGGLLDVQPGRRGGTLVRCVMPRNSLTS
jgi:PAS domain S-box-containing protein